jgi:hypothetical protein
MRGQRVLRLLDIELDERTPLAEQPIGPLGSDIIWVWIDMPSTGVALIEVRRFERPVARRTLAVASLAPEVAARVVAIAAAEMVRAQARAARAKESPKPAPGPANDEASHAHLLAGITVSAALTALVLPMASPAVLYGPELGLTHRRGATGQQLYGRWLVNAAGEDLVRWLEVGAGADLRLPLPSPDWRLHFGARAAAVSARLGGALDEYGDATGVQEWTALGAAVLGVEARLAGPTWLEIAVEPGAVLHTVQSTRPSAEPSELGGFALGLSLALNADAAFEKPALPRHAATSR